MRRRRESELDRDMAALLAARAYLWGRDHKAECAPKICGYVPEATNSAPTTT